MSFSNTQRLVVMGGGGVGKSALTVQFVQSYFLEDYDPTIEDSYRKLVSFEGKEYMLEILDTAGTEQFLAMRDLYMKNGDAFMLVYSVVSKATFLALEDMKEAIDRVKDCSSDSPFKGVVLVGNKCDLEDGREVTTAQGNNLAKNWSCTFLETSALTKHNVDEAFMATLESALTVASNGKGEEEMAARKKRSFCALF